MSTEFYAQSLSAVLVYEGGYADHPKDPGGPTMKGVTQRVYDAYRLEHGKQKQPVRNITDAELAEIYRTNYWIAIKGDLLPEGVDFVVFDGAVNSGPKQSIKWLQRALGVQADGVLGQITLAALKLVKDNDLLIAKIIERRELFLRSLKTFSTFGKGWMTRINNVKAKGQAWATGSVGPAPIYSAGGSAKAVIEDVKKAPAKVGGDVAMGGGAAGGTVGATVQTLQDQLTPFSMAGGWITKLVIALAIISALLAIGGLAWRLYATYKQRKIDDATDPDGVKTKQVPE
jgi:lysozyme family protein